MSANERCRRQRDAPVNKPFPGPDCFIHRRPFGGVPRPTFFNELPHLGDKTSRLAGCGSAGHFPWLIWMAVVSFLMFPKGMFPVNTSTTSIANANTLAGLDAPTGLLGGSMISGASHREVPIASGIAAIVKVRSEMVEPRL